MIQVGLPTAQVGTYAQMLDDFPFEEQVGQQPGGEGAGRRGRRHHAVELPAPPDRRQGGPGAGRRLHRGAQAVRGGAAQRLRAGRGRSTRPACRPVCSTSCPGVGPVVGEAIAAHPDVDMVCFTGSTRAGQAGAELAAATVKRVAAGAGRQVGQRDPRPDADLEKAVSAGVANCYLNSGQTCTAWTRMLVPRDRLADAETHRRRQGSRHYRVGDPLAEGTNLGPLISDAQRRPGPELHRAGHRRGRQAGHRRRRAARGPGPGLLRAAHRLLRGDAAT